MMLCRRLLSWRDSSDQDGWSRPDVISSLLLVSVVFVAWWALGLVFGPVWLAVTRREHSLVKDGWSTRDEP